MSGRDFLRTLHHEQKLELVSPGEGIALSYLKKSESYLASAKILLDHGRFEEAVPLTYYSMYYAVTALLFRTGIRCENHAGAIILIRDIFGINESPLNKAKRERIDTQYYIARTVTGQDVGDLVKAAEMFTSQLRDRIDRLGTREITRYRDALKDLLGP